MNGHIKLHRKIMKWGWYSHPPTLCLFIHLLLKANWQEEEWRGISLKRGQLVTGRKSLAEQTGLTERQIRTALKNLKNTGEVTIKVSNKFSILTIVKYEDYQADNSMATSKVSGKRPASDQQTTTDEEYKEIKNIRSIAKAIDKREREFNPEIDLSDRYYHEGIRLGIHADAMDYHIAAFQDVYAGKKKKDWLATWRTYCRNAVQWGHKGTKGERVAKSGSGTISSILEDF